MRKQLGGLLLSALALFGAQAGAVPVVSIGAGNVGIGSINVLVVGNVITIEEFWTSVGLGSLQISGLDASVDYTVRKIIRNNTGVSWTRLASELLDPSGQAEDALDPAQPAFVPPGFSTSNDFDGLSFAQGSGLPRTSSVFPSFLVDELTDARDFIDFFGAVLVSGGIDNFMTFGLRENFGTQQPFLLVQRPNQSSRAVPEPGTLALLGLAFVGFAAMRRRRS